MRARDIKPGMTLVHDTTERELGVVESFDGVVVRFTNGTVATMYEVKKKVA